MIKYQFPVPDSLLIVLFFSNLNSLTLYTVTDSGLTTRGWEQLNNFVVGTVNL